MSGELTYFAFSLLAYLTLTVTVGGLLFFPSAREFVVSSLRRSGKHLAASWESGLALFNRRLTGVGNTALNGLHAWLASAFHHRHWLAGGLLVLLTPLALVLLFQQDIRVGGFESEEVRSNDVVSALLAGEQLVPPPALPPEVFVSTEVERIRPTLGLANRNWDLLDSDLRRRLLAVIKLMHEQGYELALIEGYRSPQREDYLASLGPHVTQVRAYQSYHQYGLAADCAFYRDGHLVIDERDPWAMQGYRLYGEAAEKVGLTWGGRWKMMDFGHVELRRPGILKSS